jgi:hypothetical protein
MPRLSLYKPTKGNDDSFINRRMSEMFTVGGVDVYIHLYLGPLATANVSPTEPGNSSPLSTGITGIQDLLFLENRDRKYDTSVYTMRTIYRVNDNDFDLTQFGLFLTGDTMFAVFHYDDMVSTLGRKLMIGDVLEMPNLVDFYPLDDSLPVALKRFYTVADATRSAEGFAPTYWPHLWRCKLQPLVDSQEYADIINQIKAGTNTDKTIGQVMSTYQKYIDINDAIVSRAESDVPKSGYDTSSFYALPVNDDDTPGDPDGDDASNIIEDASQVATDSSSATLNPKTVVKGYLTGDGIPPNGATVAAGLAFPYAPMLGDYFLRLDYLPNRLFRFDSSRWVKVEDALRTNLTPGSQNQTQLSRFVNDPGSLYENPIGNDAFIVSNTYVPFTSGCTSSFNISTGNLITKLSYSSTIGTQVYVNGVAINSGQTDTVISGGGQPADGIDPIVVANFSGNAGFTISTNVYTYGDEIIYTMYSRVVPQRQSLSQALRPSADNE